MSSKNFTLLKDSESIRSTIDIINAVRIGMVESSEYELSLILKLMSILTHDTVVQHTAKKVHSHICSIYILCTII